MDVDEIERSRTVNEVGAIKSALKGVSEVYPAKSLISLFTSAICFLMSSSWASYSSESSGMLLAMSITFK